MKHMNWVAWFGLGLAVGMISVPRHAVQHPPLRAASIGQEQPIASELDEIEFDTFRSDTGQVESVIFAASDPTFRRSPKGWLPSCPAGMDLIRHEPKPDCFWGTAPMNRKPSQGDFECVGIGMAKNLPACPVE